MARRGKEKLRSGLWGSGCGSVRLVAVDEKDARRADHAKPELDDGAARDVRDDAREQHLAQALEDLEEVEAGLVRDGEQPDALAQRGGIPRRAKLLDGEEEEEGDAADVEDEPED